MKKHNLIQAILAVNDMFYLASPNVASLFFEDVRRWLDLSEIRYSERVTFMGQSGFPRHFDFLISKSKIAPERILQTINNPGKDSADSILLKWYDTRDVRPGESKAYAVINDEERNIPSGVVEALGNYNIKPILWSRKEEVKQELAA
jgi:hypothetical protein